MKISSAYIEITNICNLNCRSCYNRSGVLRELNEISLSDIKTIADKLVTRFQCNRISLSGGEPTLNTHFPEMLYLLTTEYSELKINVVTNGTILNDDLINAYNQNDNISIQVSLDGSNEDINSRTRGNGSFNKTLHFLSLLEKAKKPIVKMVISQNNISDIKRFYEFVVSIGGVPEFDFIMNVGNASTVWKTMLLTAQQKLSALREISALNEKHKIEVPLPYCTSSCPLADSNAERSVLIKASGDVFPCQMLHNEKYKLGNILVDDKNIMKKSLAKITKKAQERIQKDYNCGKCLAKPFCKKGCMALSELENGDPLKNDGECDFRKIQLVGFHGLRK